MSPKEFRSEFRIVGLVERLNHGDINGRRWCSVTVKTLGNTFKLSVPEDLYRALKVDDVVEFGGIIDSQVRTDDEGNIKSIDWRFNVKSTKAHELTASKPK